MLIEPLSFYDVAFAIYVAVAIVALIYARAFVRPDPEE